MNLPDKRHPDLEKIVMSIPSLSNDELLEGLLFWLGVSAICVTITAAYVAECERRGVDLSKVNTLLLQYYRLVARGTLLPEMVEKFHNRLRILSKAKVYSLDDQRRLIDSNCTLPVVVPGAEEPTEHTMVSLDKLDSQQVKQVFGEVGLRSPESQLVWIRDCSKPKSARRTVVLSFSEMEDRQILKHAKRSKMTPSAFIRDMLIANGIIKEKTA